MSGIPVYTQSPINPAKAAAVTPQTAAPQTQTMPLAPNQAPATTTALPSTTSSYPSARPGATAPTPTSAAQRYAPVQPTPTTQTEQYSPPAPQPGAVPTPMNSFENILPPPPKAGASFQAYQAPQTSATPPISQPYPPQMSYPPPTNPLSGQPSSSSTSTTTAPSAAYPVPLPNEGYGAPRQSLEHPPGYHQNVYASELTSDQRRAQDANNTPSGLGGYGSSEGTGELDYWETAKKWASSAGEKLSEGEKEVWRRINKE